jgi:hypothetical protein
MADLKHLSNSDKIQFLRLLWENKKQGTTTETESKWDEKWEEKDAVEAITTFIDSFHGRSIKIDLRGDKLDFKQYEVGSLKSGAEIMNQFLNNKKS